MPLHERRRGRADAHDQVELPLGMKCPQVFDKWRPGIVVVRSGGDQGVVCDIKRPRRLPLELGTEDPRIIIHGLKSRPNECSTITRLGSAASAADEPSTHRVSTASQKPRLKLKPQPIQTDASTWSASTDEHSGQRSY